jgi:hypothetical protein
MPYTMSKKQVPRKLIVGLAIFDVIMSILQIGAPVMTMVYAQLVNNYYFNGNTDYLAA